MLMIAPNGARLTKSDHPAVPITVEETVSVAMACRAAGAEALHLHVRDQAGRHSIDTGFYREALDALDAAMPGFPVQITTEAVGKYSVADQLKVLKELRPAWASVALRETARDKGLARELYAACKEQGTRVQHILYDLKDAADLGRAIEEGVIAQSPSVLLVLGRYADGAASDPEQIAPFLGALPEVSDWMICAFGPREHACLIAAHQMGGDLRVGFENSILDEKGACWPDMQASVSALKASLQSR